jgi:hypothetical protein
MKHLSLCALLILLTTDISLLGRRADAQSQAREAAALPLPPSNAKEPTIPEISVDNMRIDDLIAFLRDTVPTFQTVVVRDTGVPDDYPSLTLHLKNVTPDQLIEVLSQAYPSLEWSTTPGTTINVLKIHAPVDLPTSNLHVYSLTPVVSRLKEGLGNPMGIQNNLYGGVAAQPTTKEATDEQQKRRAGLNNVLSVIKAALAQVANGNSAVLQVHEETETLIFKGTQPQQEAVEQVLQALSGANAGFEGVTGRASADAEHAAAEVKSVAAQLQSQIRQLRDERQERSQVEAALQAQVEAALREIQQVNATHPATTQPQPKSKD